MWLWVKLVWILSYCIKKNDEKLIQCVNCNNNFQESFRKLQEWKIHSKDLQCKLNKRVNIFWQKHKIFVFCSSSHKKKQTDKRSAYKYSVSKLVVPTFQRVFSLIKFNRFSKSTSRTKANLKTRMPIIFLKAKILFLKYKNWNSASELYVYF